MRSLTDRAASSPRRALSPIRAASSLPLAAAALALLGCAATTSELVVAEASPSCERPGPGHIEPSVAYPPPAGGYPGPAPPPPPIHAGPLPAGLCEQLRQLPAGHPARVALEANCLLPNVPTNFPPGGEPPPKAP